MAVMTRDSWTDERLDDLNGKVDRRDARMEAGFRDLRAEIKDQGKELRAEMTTEFRGVREIGALNRSIHQLAFGLIGAVLLGFFGTIAALLTLT